MATEIKAYFVTLAYFVVSFQFQLISILLKSVETVKTFPGRYNLLFSRAINVLWRYRNSSASENEPAGAEEPPNELENRTKVVTPFFFLPRTNVLFCYP